MVVGQPMTRAALDNASLPRKGTTTAEDRADSSGKPGTEARHNSDSNNTIERRVVCAALRRGSVIVCGPRHWDSLCRGHSKDGWEQGFVDQRGVFMTREEAWQVAFDAGQIIRRVGGDGKRLFSENLY